MNKKFFLLPVLTCLALTGCGTAVSGADRTRAQRYYQYLPVCQSISGTAVPDDTQLETLDSEFHLWADAYEQTMYHIVGKSSYMNEICCIFPETLVSVQNYSPMASVLYQHQGEIAMNPILLMRGVLEGDGDSATEYDSYTEHIFRSETETVKETAPESWESPTELYTGSAEAFIRKLFSPYTASENLQIGHTSDSKGNPDMYYVYLIEAREDLEFYAFYFYLNENGVFYQASMDYLLYGGNEMASASCFDDYCLKHDACIAGESHAEEKFVLLENILDVSPSRKYAGTYDGYDLGISGFTREYISDTAGKIAILRHRTYQMQKPQE
ncbi:MAG: hypothetical protein IJ642_09005 [Oscillospiraceae bacterium]|nr:hypothetical protein [Oscillospiraceae bacterium]